VKGPRGIAVSAFDELVVADHDNRRVALFTADGDVRAFVGPGSFTGVAVCGGTVMVRENDTSCTVIFSTR
jgi:hypothetical protein